MTTSWVWPLLLNRPDLPPEPAGPCSGAGSGQRTKPHHPIAKQTRAAQSGEGRSKGGKGQMPPLRAMNPWCWIAKGLWDGTGTCTGRDRLQPRRRTRGRRQPSRAGWRWVVRAHRADLTMHQVKAAGRDGVALYDRAVDQEVQDNLTTLRAPATRPARRGSGAHGPAPGRAPQRPADRGRGPGAAVHGGGGGRSFPPTPSSPWRSRTARSCRWNAG